MAGAGAAVVSAPPLPDRVAATRWYHTLELPDGIVTPGEYDLRPIVARLPWPDLAGARCLDIGSRDGFYAFEMERRGAAEVVSVDLDDPGLIDFPWPPARREDAQRELDAGNVAFALAHEALGSAVRRVHASIYALDPETVGRFDFALIGTLLLHLRDPVRGLLATRSVTRRLLVNDAVTPGVSLMSRRPSAELRMSGGLPFWWLANPAGLRRMVTAAGFAVEGQGRPYLVPRSAGASTPSLRASIRGPVADLPRRLSLRRGVLHAWILAR